MSEHVRADDTALPDLSSLRPESFQLQSGDPWSTEAAEANGVSDFTPVVEVTAKPQPVKAEPNFDLEEEPLWDVKSEAEVDETLVSFVQMLQQYWSGRTTTGADPMDPILLWQAFKDFCISQRPYVKWWALGFMALMLLLVEKVFGFVVLLAVLCVPSAAVVVGIYLTSNGGAARKEWEARFHQWFKKDGTEGGGQDVLDN